MVTMFVGHVWSDGTNWDFSAWKQGEPNDVRNAELCTIAEIASLYGNPATMVWNDKYCEVAHNYICQVPTGTNTNENIILFCLCRLLVV